MDNSRMVIATIPMRRHDVLSHPEKPSKTAALCHLALDLKGPAFQGQAGFHAWRLTYVMRHVAERADDD